MASDNSEIEKCRFNDEKECVAICWDLATGADCENKSSTKVGNACLETNCHEECDRLWPLLAKESCRPGLASIEVERNGTMPSSSEWLLKNCPPSIEKLCSTTTSGGAVAVQGNRLSDVRQPDSESGGLVWWESVLIGSLVVLVLAVIISGLVVARRVRSSKRKNGRSIRRRVALSPPASPGGLCSDSKTTEACIKEGVVAKNLLVSPSPTSTKRFQSTTIPVEIFASPNKRNDND